MSRTRASAKQAGASFERVIADALALHVDDRIDRRVKTGNKDRGDIGGVRFARSATHRPGGRQRLVIECKDVARTDLSGWVNEAEIERGNDDALAGFVVHKRRGHGDPLDQYVTCTVRDLVAYSRASGWTDDRRPAHDPPRPSAPCTAVAAQRACDDPAQQVDFSAQTGRREAMTQPRPQAGEHRDAYDGYGAIVRHGHGAKSRR